MSLKPINKPVEPWLEGNSIKRYVDVLDFTAKGDGISDDTKAFQDRWVAACKMEASTMLVLANYIFKVGPISFSGPYCKSNIVFQLDGIIIAPTDPQAWGGGLFQWLEFSKLVGITIQGKGITDGKDSVWWQDQPFDDPIDNEEKLIAPIYSEVLKIRTYLWNNSRMDVAQVLRVNGGIGETSNANNSLLERKAVSLTKPMRDEAIQCFYRETFPLSQAIAELGCSSGPNTSFVTCELIETVEKLCRDLNHESPEYTIFLNDLPSNDFNNIFKSIESFKLKLREGVAGGIGSCYIAGVPRSFYGRIFPILHPHLNWNQRLKEKGPSLLIT
ncbi:uncharacterized protein LOC114756951 [Neltuma alba]|uniref:uncharacterized protein LOC114756951 n=1 Tax=Neltuma alba TaxID=207710 RepID=UPI0010A30317|nr:uncharacterized protein LOC114756951 [Prosopis alba]